MWEQNRLAAADMLYAARNEKALIEALSPELWPGTEGEAYDIQAALVRRLGGPAAGWKVGATAEGARAALKTDRPFSGRVLGGNVHSSPADLSGLRLQSPRVEAEYVFRLSSLKSGDGVSDEKILSAITGIYPGIEVCGSAFRDPLQVGVESVIADNGLASHLILGEPGDEVAHGNIVDQEVAMFLNGRERQRGDGRVVLGNPLNSLIWLARHILGGGQDIPEGSLVASGSCTGMLEVQAGDHVEVRFGSLGNAFASF